MMRLWIGLGIGSLFSFSATAELVRWTQTGAVRTFDPLFWDSSVFEGATFQASVLYDTATPPSFPNSSDEAQYVGSPISASLSFGNYHFVFASYDPGFLPVITVRNNYNEEDGYFWFWSTPASQHGLTTPFTWGHLLSSDLSLLNDVNLDIREFEVSRFDVQHNRQLNGYDSLGNFIDINFNVTSYSITAVPEPSTTAILVCGVLLVAASNLWKRR